MKKGFFKACCLLLAAGFSLFLVSCDFFTDFFADGEKEKKEEVKITSLRLSSSNENIKVGSISYLAYYVTPSGTSIKPEWKYDSKIISIEEQGQGVIITGLKEGETALTISYGSFNATSVVRVKGFAENYVDNSEPYIVSDTQVLNIETGSSELVSVSIFNGNASDVSGYTWTIDKPSVAELSPTGQYCRIKGKSQGAAQITVTHKSTKDAYLIGLYVFDDITKATYITTKYNLSTLKVQDGDKQISCDLINPLSADYKSKFTWSIKSQEENTSSITDSDILSITANGNECILTPKKEGIKEIVISHPDAPYPLVIKARVVEIVDNVYIEPDQTMIELSGKGTNTKTVSMDLKGIKEGSWSPDDFKFTVYQNENLLEAGSNEGCVSWFAWGNNITFTGIHDGAVIVYVSHPCALNKRQLLVISQNQPADFIDASVSINTTQDYIKTKAGADEIFLKVSLQGGSPGDENNFTWSISQKSADGKSNVISTRTSFGKITEEDSSRMASPTYSDAGLYISPLAEGQATITVSHPKSYYDREITVKVLNKDAVIEEPYYFTGDGIIRFLNNQTYNAKIRLVGALESEKTGISWRSDDESLSIISDGENAMLSSSASGSNIFHITVDHKKAEGKKEITVLTADTQEELDSMQAFYSDKSYYSIDVGKQTQLFANTIGFDTEEESFDWTSASPEITWESSDYSVCTVEKNTVNPLSATVSGIKEGSSKITLRYRNLSLAFTVRVYPVIISGNGSGTSLLTKQLYFKGDGIIRFLNNETYRASVSLVGATESDKNKITWESDNEKLSVNANGENAILESKASGQNISHITISHPDAEGNKEILVMTADTQDELNSMKAFYADKTSYVVTKGKSVWLYADSTGFTDEDGNPLDFADVKDQVEWKSLDENVCTVLKDSGNPLNALVTGINEGSTKITLSYQNVKLSFNVSVYSSISSSHQLEETSYLSIFSNVVILKADENREISVTPYGIDSSAYGQIEWNVKTPDVISLVPNEEKATLTALNEGETEIWVSHPLSENTVKIHVKVGSEYMEQASKPVVYIATNTDLIAVLKDSTTNYMINAVLANANTEDSLDGFAFEIEDPEIGNLTAYPSGKAYFKPLKAGQTEITITHEKAKYPKKILCVVANSVEELAGFTYLSTSQNVVNIGEGSTETIKVNVENSQEMILDGFLWSIEDENVASIVKSSAGQILVKGNRIGTTRLLVSNSKLAYNSPLEIIIQVVDTSVLAKNPYVIANPPIVTILEGGGWTSLSASLQGGTEEDKKDFTWTVSDPTILELYGQNDTARVRAKSQGSALVRVMHPKANYPAQIRCICEEKSKADVVISLSCPSVLSIRPDEGDYTITANLVNGTTAGRYKFKWELSAATDGNTNPIVELIDSENTAVITPKREGSVKLRVSNEESAYSKEITIKVQNFENFSFGSDYFKIVQGKTSFIQMEVPATSEECIVSYESNDSNVCTVGGTNAICELKGILPGTTSVTATLKTKKGTILSSSEMLVYVEESAKNITYVNGDSGSSVSITKGTRKTLHASLVGSDVDLTDSRSLCWELAGENSGIIRMIGATEETYSVDGTSKKVYRYYGDNVDVEALGPGECTLTVNHDKAQGNGFTYRIYVPGSGTKAISLSKNYFSLDKGSSQELVATIDGGSKDDYKNIKWTFEKNESNPNDMITILGSGKTVSIYAIETGTTVVTAEFEGNTDTCTIKVEARKALSLASNSITVHPNGTAQIKYYVIPSDSQITWVTTGTAMGGDFFNVSDSHADGSGRTLENGSGVGILTISGITTGKGVLSGSTIWGSKATAQVFVDWGYKLIPELSSLICRPGEEVTLWYYKNPVGKQTEVKLSTPENESEYWADYFEIVKKGDIPLTCPDAKEDPEGAAAWDEFHAGRSFITFKSLRETPAGGIDVLLKLSNSDDPAGTLPEAVITLSSVLKDIKLLLTNPQSNGNFSRVVEGNSGIYTIYLGDGETFNLDVAFENQDYLTDLTWSVEEKTDVEFAYEIKSKGWEPSTYINTADPTNVLVSAGENTVNPYKYSIKKTATGICVSSPADYTAYVYNVTDAWLPYRTVTRSNPSGGAPMQVEVLVDGWNDDQKVYWGTVSDGVNGGGIENKTKNDFLFLSEKGFTIERNPNNNSTSKDLNPDILHYILGKSDDDSTITWNRTDYNWKKATNNSYLKEYLPSEFEHIALWYCPGSPSRGFSETWVPFRMGDSYNRGGYGGNSTVSLNQGILSDVCTAEYRISKNKSVRAINTEPLVIKLNLKHGKENITKEIILFVELRSCLKNQN